MHLGILHKSHYEMIFERKREKLNFTLNQLEITFKGAERETIIQMSYDFIKRTYPLNQTIFKQHDEVDGINLMIHQVSI
jgi:hypothetical protein